METKHAWNLLQCGRVEQGLQELRGLTGAQPTTSEIIEVGIAYLWAEQYQTARTHFTSALAQYPQSISSLYGLSGTAKWCLGEFREAIDEWQAGLKAKFADTGGLGIRLPLLMYVAATLRPEILRRSSVEELLRRRMTDPRAAIWPGPIASWLLGQITDQELDDQSRFGLGGARSSREWLLKFYRCIRYRENDNDSARDKLVALTEIAAPEHSDQGVFLSTIWNEEFFIGRSEGLRMRSI